MDDRARTRMRWIGWLAGAALLAFLVERVGWDTLLQDLSRVGPGFLWLPAVYIAANVVMAIPFYVFMPRDMRPPLAAAIASRLAASNLNAFLPFIVLGEVSRLFWLRREHWPEGIAVVLVDRLLYLMASAIGVGGAGVAMLFIQQAPREVAIASGAAGLILAIAATLLATVGARRAPAQWIGRTVDRVRRSIGRDAGPATAPHGIDAALKRVLAGPPSRLALGIVLHLAGRALLTMEIVVSLRLLGVPADLPLVLVFAAVPLVISVVGAIIPSQIGIQEGAQAAVAAMCGLKPSVGVLVVLLLRGRQLLLLPLTAALLATRPRSATSQAPPHVAPHLPS